MSVGTITRMALEVPIVIAQFSSVAQPEPTLAAAPSPMAGNQGISCNAGQRDANSGFRPVMLSCRSPNAGNCSSRMPSTSRSCESQEWVRVTSMPVPEAIERLQTERPKKRRCKYSPKDSHCTVRLNSSGCAVESQRSFAGQ